MKKIDLKNFSLDEVLTKDELKKIVGGNGSGCADFLCACYGEEGEEPVVSNQTFCSGAEIAAFADSCVGTADCAAIG